VCGSTVELIEQIFDGVGVIHAHQQQIVLPTVPNATLHQHRGKFHAIGGGPFVQLELFKFPGEYRGRIIGVFNFVQDRINDGFCIRRNQQLGAIPVVTNIGLRQELHQFHALFQRPITQVVPNRWRLRIPRVPLVHATKVSGWRME